MVRIPLPCLALTGACLLLAADAAAETPAPAPVAQKTPAPPNGARPAPKAQPKKAVAARRKSKGDKAPPVITGAVASSPGFRMLEEGKSRVFVEVSQKVEVTEQKARGRVIYQLRGASVPVRNSRLPLLTSFFATPVGQVELIG